VTSVPRTITGSLFSSLDRIPWWILVLLGLGALVVLYVLTPANVTATRVVPELAVDVGDEFTYSIQIKNSGPSDAVKVSLTEQLPESLAFVEAKPAPSKQEAGRLRWDVEDLSDGEELIYQVTVGARTAGTAGDLLPLSRPTMSWRTVSLDILDFLSIGAKVTILVTLYSFLLAVFLGLIAGLGRVTEPPPGFHVVYTRRFLIRGLVRILVGLVGYYVLATTSPALPRLTLSLGAALSIVAYLAPVVLHPYTLSTVYVEIFRGVPMLVQVLYLGFVVRPFVKGFLSQLLGTNVAFDEFTAAILGLGLGYGAYIAEVFRAGIQSIHRGQMEAALSLGMTYFQAMRYIVLPQAVRRVLPPLANDGVALLKDSSFVSVLSVADLTRQGRLYMSRTYRAFESWNMVAFSYLVLTFLLSGVARVIERRMSVDDGQ